MTYISQSGSTLSVDLNGFTQPGDSVDANYKALTIGGAAKPLKFWKIHGNTLSVTIPAGYGGEPASVLINSFQLEKTTLAAAAVTTVTVTNPSDEEVITEEGTAAAKVYDQYGEEMTGQTITWSSSDSTKLSIVSATGVYTPVADAEGIVITATCGAKTGTVTVDVDVT